MKKKSIISGTIVLTVAGFFCKFIGAFSKVPLTNILSSSGVGIYQLIFPLYSLLLLISSSGIPIAISKIISENNSEEYSKKIVGYALKLMLLISSVLTLLIIVLSGAIANIQSNAQLKFCYIIISPSIVFVSLISVFRGYFQGNQNFTPTAISQIVEQVIKISLSLILAYFLTKIDIIYGVMGAVASITLSELFALLYLIIRYKKNIRKNTQIIQKNEFNRAEIRKVILKTALPITITAIIFPVFSFIDSIMFMQGLTEFGYKTEIVTSLYGVESGIINALLNLPIVFTTAICSSIIPLISSNTHCETNCTFAYKSVIFVMLPIVVFYIIFSKRILVFLFSNALSGGVFNLMHYATNLLMITSVTMLYASISSLSTAILQAKNFLWTPFITYLSTGIIKIIINFILLNFNGFNIYSISISSVVLYFVCAVVLLYKVKNLFNFKLSYQLNVLYPMCLISILTILFSKTILNISSNFISLLIGGMVFIVGIWASLIILKFYDNSEISHFMFKNKSIVYN